MIFKNQLGTAAGLDKNGDFIDALGELGFGFLEIGTTTPLPQDGNPKPRVFRNYKENSIINRLGFNNKGVDYLVNNLKKRKYKGIVGVNIGANKTSSGKQRIDDFLICLEKVHKFADYITINISSPNTPNLISPDESDQILDNIITAVSNSFITGIIATNTTISKSKIINDEFKQIEGGLSGQFLMDESTKRLSYIRNKSNNMPLIGVGGVMSREDFLEKIDAGAHLVQLYTGFIIKGPNLINQILKD